MEKHSRSTTTTRKSASSPLQKKTASHTHSKSAAIIVNTKPKSGSSAKLAVKRLSEGRVIGGLTSVIMSAYCATDVERVAMIRQGVPATLLVGIGRAMNVSNEVLLTTLALPRSTIVRKIKKKESLTAEQSERVIGLERLVGQVAEMVKQSGNPEGFDAGHWVGEWLQRPLPALAGKKPADYMDTMSGQDLVSKLLAQSQSGAYA